MSSVTKDQVIRRLKKIQELARKGTDGEAAAAKSLLMSIAKQHCIDLNAIVSEEREFKFKTSGWRMQLLLQLCAFICGPSEFKAKQGATRNELVITCHEDEWLEIVARFKILEKDYKQQLSLFYEAFIICNGLALKSTSDNGTQLSAQDEDRVKKAMKLAKGLTRSKRPNGKMLELKA